MVLDASGPTPLCTAGELSGDALAGAVLRCLGRRRPEQRWRGAAGPAMRASGVLEPLAKVEDLGGAGLVELVPRLPALARARSRLLAALRGGPPLAVFVDAPDLHLPLALRARRLGIRTALLVVPQFWAWRPQRRRAVARAADLALCLFEHEVAPLRSLGVPAFWVGHPAVTLPLAAGGDRAPTLAVLPGSRPSEVHRHLRPFLLAGRAAGWTRFEVPWRLRPPPPSLPGVTFCRDPGVKVLDRCDAALVAVGTATLQAAVIGLPTVAAAALHPASAWVARRLVRAPHLALPNVLLGRTALPEVLQDLSVAALSPPLRGILGDLSGARRRARALSEEVRASLGPPGFAERAADHLLRLLDAR